jgi:hypothetical protein
MQLLECQWEKVADGVRCIRCCKPESRPLRRRCRLTGEVDPVQEQHEGLGDWTEQMLKQIGVTPERWGEAKALVGLDPSCNCATRKAWLNKVSDWWRK